MLAQTGRIQIKIMIALRACNLCTRNETEKSGNVTPARNPFMATARGILGENPLVGWVSREQTSCARAELSVQFSRETCTEGEGGGWGWAGGGERGEKSGKKKIVRRGIGSVSPVYNRQEVDSRLLDLRQSNFANETYPVTQLASIHARTHTHAN